MIDVSNEQQRRSSTSIQCEDLYSSATPYAEELENDVEFLIHDQDLCQCHFPGEQNCAEYGNEEVYSSVTRKDYVDAIYAHCSCIKSIFIF